MGGEPTGDFRTVNEPRWNGVVRMVPEHLADPLRWRKPRRVFVNSMSDLFHEALSNEDIAAVFGVMAAAPRHTFQVLTKRAERMRDWFRWLEAKVEPEAEEWSGRDCGASIHDARTECLLEYLDDTACAAAAGHFNCCHLGITTSKKIRWPLPNVWLGVSVENQAAADERIPHLLATPAVVRFLSCEPLIGAVSLAGEWWLPRTFPPATTPVTLGHSCIDWVITGCESGPGARPAEVDWYRALRDQCAAAGVPFFLKQAVRASYDEHDQVEGWQSRQVLFGPGSERKAGGVVGLPYLDGVQHAAFPTEVRS